MITMLGIIVLLLVLASYLLQKINASIEVENERIRQINSKNPDSYYHKQLKSKAPSLNLPGKLWYWLVLAVCIFMLKGVFFYNPAGTITSVQYFWGGDKMVSSQGIKVKAYGKLIPISYEISIQDVILQKDQTLSKNEPGTYNRNAKEWEFADAIKARIATAIIIEVITEDEESFLSMADRNRTEGKLIRGRVLPNIEAALKNTCKLMDAQDYISGEASTFDRYFRDQLENGMYILEEYYDKEKLPEIIGDTSTIRIISNQGIASKQKKFKIQYDNQGNPIRDTKSNSLSQYGLNYAQAMVTSIDWEPSFDTRLDKQKDEVAKTQLEKQEAERQYYTAKKNEAEAESNKVAKRGQLELQQIEKTIAAETLAKSAKFKEEEETNLLAAANKEAQRIKVLADAESYKNQRLVQAGLTPQERATLDEQMNRDKWANVSKMKFDGVYMMGGTQQKSGDGILSALLGAEVAKKMNSKK